MSVSVHDKLNIWGLIYDKNDGKMDIMYISKVDMIDPSTLQPNLSANAENSLSTIIKQLNTSQYDSQNLDLSEQFGGNGLNDRKIIAALCEALAKAPQVTRVSIYNNRIDYENLSCLLDVPTIQELVLDGQNLSSHVLKQLVRKNLKHLHLDHCIHCLSLDDDEVSSLMDLFTQNKTIESLSIIDWYLPNAVLSNFIKNNTVVKELFLGGGINDNDLMYIGDNKYIEKLIILESSLTNKAIQYISQNASIQELVIQKSNINDGSVDFLLKCLNIKKLHISNSDISFDAAKLLMKTTPIEECYIFSPCGGNTSSLLKWRDLNREFKTIRATTEKDDSSVNQGSLETQEIYLSGNMDAAENTEVE